MKKLQELIADAEKKRTAIGHFNTSDTPVLHAIFHAARRLNVPVIIGTSESERDFIGTRQAVALVRSLREEYDYPVFLNADHTYSFEKVKEAVDAGYDAVIFDGVKLSFEENVAVTKQCVEYARSVNPDILVEGELGYIGSSSKLLDEIPEGAEVATGLLTKPDVLSQFVKETGVDLVAPAVGNIHGMLKSGKNPTIDTELIKKLREACDIPLVLHGGSGITDDEFTTSIKAGISIVHINTEIRVAYRKEIERALAENPDEFAPYRYLKPAAEAVERIVERRLRLFSNV